MPLGFGGSTFRFAARPGAFAAVSDLAGRRVATSYAGLVDAYLCERGVQAEVVRLDGAVETAVRLGVADVIADVVETGGTLRAAGLVTFGDPILQSEAVLIQPPATAAGARDDGSTPASRGGEATVMIRRLSGVLVARQYVLVEKACEITPGLESPTIAPLHDTRWAAVRVMVPRHRTHHVMDDLYALGARAILVTSIHACRL
jgi:ATP phosphoribosyltransferase